MFTRCLKHYECRSFMFYYFLVVSRIYFTKSFKFQINFIYAYFLNTMQRRPVKGFCKAASMQTTPKYSRLNDVSEKLHTAFRNITTLKLSIGWREKLEIRPRPRCQQSWRTSTAPESHFCRDFDNI